MVSSSLQSKWVVHAHMYNEYLKTSSKLKVCFEAQNLFTHLLTFPRQALQLALVTHSSTPHLFDTCGPLYTTEFFLRYQPLPLHSL